MNGNDMSIWKKVVLTRRVNLAMRFVFDNLWDVLHLVIKRQVEGKCIANGYVKPDSVHIVSHSSGLLKAADVVFDIVFECEVCFPMNGQVLTCVIKSKTSAGIRAEVSFADAAKSPIVVFLARDHHLQRRAYLTLDKMSDEQLSNHPEIQVKVIGQRFQINDDQIRVIAELLDESDGDGNSRLRVSDRDAEDYSTSVVASDSRKRKVVASHTPPQ
jgi:DNA-directed RNA polymerase subunit E'/Rpb7